MSDTEQGGRKRYDRYVTRRSNLPERGYGCIALDQPKDAVNVGHALRAALLDAEGGRGGIVTIMAEAGLGKSRLVAELVRDQIGERVYGAENALLRDTARRLAPAGAPALVAVGMRIPGAGGEA